MSWFINNADYESSYKTLTTEEGMTIYMYIV